MNFILFRSMFIRISVLFLIILFASCSNYRNLKFLRTGNYSEIENIQTDVDYKADEGTQLSSPCDTVYFKNENVYLLRAGRIGSKYMDLFDCENGERFSFLKSEIESVKYSNGTVWPPINSICDTIFLTDGTIKLVKDTVYFKNGNVDYLRAGRIGVNYVDLFDCENGKHFTPLKKEIDSIKFSSGLVWPATNSLCDTILLVDGSKKLVKVTSISTRTVAMITCEDKEQDIPNIKLTEIAMINFANGHSWNTSEVVAKRETKREEKKLELKKSNKTDNLKALMLIGLIAGGIIIILGILISIFLPPHDFTFLLLFILCGLILLITGLLIGRYLKKHS